MSEFDSGAGRKGFVRDVMRRMTPASGQESEESDSERERSMTRSMHEEIEDLREALRFFGADSAEFRRRLDRVLGEYEAMRRRYQLVLLNQK